MTPQPAEQNDFRAYLRALWRWKWLMLAFLIVVPLIAYVLEVRKERIYQSSTLVQPQAVQLDPSLFGGTTVSSSQNILAIARLIKTTEVASAAAKLMPNGPPNGGSLLGHVTVNPDTDTGFVTINATDPDPQRAAAIANAFGQAISQDQSNKAQGQITKAIDRIKRQQSQLAANDQVGREQLSGELQRLRSLQATATNSGSAIIEKAQASSTPTDRNTRRAIELGLVIALLLGFGAVAIAENSDRRVRSPDDLESMTGLSLLSAIPSSAFNPEEDDDLRDEEAFQMLRGALMYFNVDQRLRSVVITSPGQEDGKTTVAVRLAQSAARAGRRVILVDADLRRPQIGPRLHISATEGLGSVLAGETDLWSALYDVPVTAEGDAQITSQGGLRVLPAGVAAPNPSELLSSDRMQHVLEQLQSDADLVIVDSAAALAVSDALPLLRWTSGVVMIARLNRSTRAGIRRLQKIIVSANGKLLGVVATGVPTRGFAEGYGYGYGYKDSRARKRAHRKHQDKLAEREAAGAAPPQPSQPPQRPSEPPARAQG